MSLPVEAIDMAINNITQDNLRRSEEAKVKLLREALTTVLNTRPTYSLAYARAEEEARRILAETEGKP